MSSFRLPYYVVDAFADGPFTGNPAGVCPVEVWPADAVLQAVAAQNNLSETAFFKKEGAAYRLRWFAPLGEIDLCGHATLAAAHVLYTVHGRKDPSTSFLTRSGELKVGWEGSRYVMDFPAIRLAPVDAPAGLAEGLGAKPRAVFSSMDWVCMFNDEDAVRALKPDLEKLKKLDLRGVVVTAPGRQSDYVLRCFGPKLGIAEDPVTGSAQSMLAPFWTSRLNKAALTARQLSARGGTLWCESFGDRVKISGRARTYLRGEIEF
jgi:predicted PhzF superfamily epimerase YddE/YHI9